MLLAEPVLTLTTLSTWNERGLVGLEFDPEFESNGYIYIQYTWTDGTDVNARVSRFALNGSKAVEGSETILFEGDPYSNNVGMHNGGSLIIDKDDKLFIFIGDTNNRTLAQDLRSTYGKVLRINLDGTIPEDNPYNNEEHTAAGKLDLNFRFLFVWERFFRSQITTLTLPCDSHSHRNNYLRINDALGINPAIWASGLRNPFVTVYNHETDQTIIGDVGEGTRIYSNMDVNIMSITG